MLLLTVLACTSPTPTDPDPTVDGLTITTEPGTWAGAASVDITPEGFETFTDENGDNLWIGCFDGTCGEPFDDANGNGRFDPTFIGGFSPLRPALEVHDPISARAAIVSHDGDYLNREVSLLGGEDGDHYEDTVSPASTFATRLLEAHDTLDQRW